MRNVSSDLLPLLRAINKDKTKTPANLEDFTYRWRDSRATATGSVVLCAYEHKKSKELIMIDQKGNTWGMPEGVPPFEMISHIAAFDRCYEEQSCRNR